MSRHALLIGSPFGGLTCGLKDLQLMHELLGRHGFAATCCSGQAATRDGVIGAWQRLIRDTAEGDAVPMYYSGHGGIAVAAADPAAKQPWRYQFIVSMDFDETSETDFRGITSP